MPQPATSAPLGEFELLVLLSTLSLGEAAYPVSIAADIELCRLISLAEV